MKINSTVLTYNCYHFLKHVDAIIRNTDEGCVITVELEKEKYAIDKDTTIYDRLNIIGRCWITNKRKIKKYSENNDEDIVLIKFSEVKQAKLLGATESIVNILKDKNKSNNVKFLEINMVINTIRKSME